MRLHDLWIRIVIIKCLYRIGMCTDDVYSICDKDLGSPLADLQEDDDFIPKTAKSAHSNTIDDRIKVGITHKNTLTIIKLHTNCMRHTKGVLYNRSIIVI